MPQIEDHWLALIPLLISWHFHADGNGLICDRPSCFPFTDSHTHMLRDCTVCGRQHIGERRTVFYVWAKLWLLVAGLRSKWALLSSPPSPVSQFVASLWKSWPLLLLSAELSAGVTITFSVFLLLLHFSFFLPEEGVINYSSANYLCWCHSWDLDVDNWQDGW